MMMVSANDAAVAIGEKLGGGSLDGYTALADRTPRTRLQLADQPVFNDPAGLDDEFSNKGGSRISPARPRDRRAEPCSRSPTSLRVINARDYQFTGGDGIDHTLSNHDLFLDLYPGANGLKTGTTELAGHTFVGSATRGGRTMLAIVFDAVDYYGSAGALLDQGFNTPVSAEASLDHLPAVVPTRRCPPPTAGRRGARRCRRRSGRAAWRGPVADRLARTSRCSCSSSGSCRWSRSRRRTVVRRQQARAAARRRAGRRRRRCDLHGVPDESGVFVGLEEEFGGVVLVDVADEHVVDAVADELAQPRREAAARSRAGCRAAGSPAGGCSPRSSSSRCPTRRSSVRVRAAAVPQAAVPDEHRSLRASRPAIES